MDDWKPASDAPIDVKVKARFTRDGEVIERRMMRLRKNLWWDDEYSVYARTNPTHFTKLEPLI